MQVGIKYQKNKNKTQDGRLNEKGICFTGRCGNMAIQIANKNYPQDAVNRLGDFIIRNYKESEKIKEPIEGIKRLVEGLRKDVKKL